MHPFKVVGNTGPGRTDDWVCYYDVTLIAPVKDRMQNEICNFPRAEWNKKLNKIWVWVKPEDHRTGKGPDFEMSMMSPWSEVKMHPQHNWHNIFTYEEKEGNHKFKRCWFRGEYYAVIGFQADSLQLNLQCDKTRSITVYYLNPQPLSMEDYLKQIKEQNA